MRYFHRNEEVTESQPLNRSERRDRRFPVDHMTCPIIKRGCKHVLVQAISRKKKLVSFLRSKDAKISRFFLEVNMF